MVSLQEFVAKYNGKSKTVDGNYPTKQPYQCWDIAELYCREVLEIPHNPWALPTGDGTAAGSYLLMPPDISTYFLRKKRVRVPTGILNSRPQYGDLVFWSKELPGSGGAGHVSICLSPYEQNRYGFLGFDQNWSAPKALRTAHNYSYVLGYLRPRKAIK